MELGRTTNDEIPNKESQPNRFNATEINPDKLIEPSTAQRPGASRESFDLDRLIEPMHRETSDIMTPASEISRSDASETKLYTNSKERIDRTPMENVKWTGGRGDSKCIPLDKEVCKELKKHGIDGIEYRDGVVDFSPISAQNVTIDMTSSRPSNFMKANTQAAKRWNAEARGNRTDWTPRDVEKWRKENGYTWHECSDQKTCMLIPHDLHEAFRHSGGVAECKRRDGIANGGGFDE